MEIIIIVAYSKNRVIGRQNTIPWHLIGDMKHFKQTTINNQIIMGRKTWESLKIKPLPNRKNIIITNNTSLTFKDGVAAYSLYDAIQKCSTKQKVFIIGGEQLYKQFMPLSSTIIATEIHNEFQGDAFFPKINKKLWIEEKRDHQLPENGLKYDFVIYKKIARGLLWNNYFKQSI
ncbi:dihydrofolate reductase [Candidatus Kinetoplastidibacterium crithidiae]|uniref:Dihydrofolate reductase n=1 Tax=Candidatus Kinetoplastidibacterium crithidiae TCC036E TaxID=1208918 RepID=M1LTG4_9PROT|nr:dihydrofolate reductase [Candidatus Kinetoplastibacterium crithidii]AFZ83115.1 dihydrofolate reductase [Candidatus Kinetoplastibacterium crithidii (ex Angomonas deanei ATCC 30255)]AGF47391.1 dihydrofolate reductase [Candidatus Kinetoplastibacterium crithidii TCC036E]